MERPTGGWSSGAGDRARLDATVRGIVQGVGFRFFVVRVASGLDLEGWVANRPDGAVECRAEGPRAALDELLVALRDGPPGAAVAEVEVRWLAPGGGLGPFGVRSFGHPGD